MRYVVYDSGISSAFSAISHPRYRHPTPPSSSLHASSSPSTPPPVSSDGITVETSVLSDEAAGVFDAYLASGGEIYNAGSEE